MVETNEQKSGTRRDNAIHWADEDLSWTWTDSWHSLSIPTQKFHYDIGTDERGTYLVRNQDEPLKEDDYGAKRRKVPN